MVPLSSNSNMFDSVSGVSALGVEMKYDGNDLSLACALWSLHKEDSKASGYHWKLTLMPSAWTEITWRSEPPESLYATRFLLRIPRQVLQWARQKLHHTLWSNLGGQECHFHLVVFIRIVTSPPEARGGTKDPHLSRGGCPGHLAKEQRGIGGVPVVLCNSLLPPSCGAGPLFLLECKLHAGAHLVFLNLRWVPSA